MSTETCAIMHILVNSLPVVFIFFLYVSASRSVLIIIIIKLSPEISEVTGGKPQHREIIRVFLNF